MPEGWWGVTWVCSYWRTVALATPSLFAVIHQTNPNIWRFQTFLERSAHIPVDVDFGEGGIPNVSYFLDILFLYAEQLRSLRMALPEEALEEFFSGPMVGMNQLEQLNLSFSPRVYHDWGRATSSSVCIPPPRDLFSKLRAVTFKNLRTSWDTGFFACLTHLSLENPVIRPSFRMFRELLHSSPDLEVLKLINAGPLIDTAMHVPPHVDDPIPLSHLTSLTVEDDHVSSSAHAISHITISFHTKVDVSGKYWDHGQVPLILRSLIPRQDDSLSILHIAQALEVIAEEPIGCGSVTVRAHHNLRAEDPSPDLIIHLLPTARSDPVIQEGLVPILSTISLLCFSLSHLKIVEVSDKRIPTEQWTTALIHMNSLEYLEFRFFGGYTIDFRAFFTAIQFPPNAPLDQVLCPRLKKLVLDSTRRVPLLPILTYVQERAIRGRHLETLTLRGREVPCRPFPEKTNRILKAITKSVDEVHLAGCGLSSILTSQDWPRFRRPKARELA